MMMISKLFIVICCVLISYGCGFITGFGKGSFRPACLWARSPLPMGPTGGSSEVRKARTRVESTLPVEPIKPVKRIPKPLVQPLEVEPWDDPKIKEILKAQGIDVTSLLNLQKEVLQPKESKYGNSNKSVNGPKKAAVDDSAKVSGNPGDYLNFADFLTANSAALRSISQRVTTVPNTKVSTADSQEDDFTTNTRELELELADDDELDDAAKESKTARSKPSLKAKIAKLKISSDADTDEVGKKTTKKPKSDEGTDAGSKKAAKKSKSDDEADKKKTTKKSKSDDEADKKKATKKSKADDEADKKKATKKSKSGDEEGTKKVTKKSKSDDEESAKKVTKKPKSDTAATGDEGKTKTIKKLSKTAVEEDKKAAKKSAVGTGAAKKAAKVAKVSSSDADTEGSNKTSKKSSGSAKKSKSTGDV